MNNYCVFEDKSVGKIDPCDCNKYCPTKECIEFVGTHRSDGKKINMKEIDSVLANNNIVDLENKLTEKRSQLKSNSEFLKSDKNKAKIYAKNLIDNSLKLEKFDELVEVKNETIKDYNKILDILDSKKDRYTKLNDEVFEEEIEAIKKIFIAKIDTIRHKSELIQIDDSEFQENKKKINERIDEFKSDKKELSEIVLKMEGEINTNKEILEKRKKDFAKLNKMLEEDEKELKINTEKVNEKCNIKEEKCPDHLKKVLIILFLFAIIVYYSLHKINY